MPTREQLLDVIKLQAEIAQLGLDLGGMIQLIAERAPALVDADGAAIELVEGENMVYQSATGIARGQVGLRLPRNNSLSGLCTQTGEALRCDDSETDARVDRNACQHIGLRSMLVIPLKHKGEAIGVLKAMSTQPGKFDEHDMELLKLLSELAGASMYFATHYNNDNLYYLATHDSLTGLANRSQFLDRLRHACDQSARDGRSVALLMIDLDGFKQINDTFGHRVGDAVLREFAKRLQAGSRSSDTVARLGGDEFTVLLTPLESLDDVDVILQRLQDEINVPFFFEGQAHQLHASIGMASLPNDACEIYHLMDIADQRMYAIKQKHHQFNTTVTADQHPR